MPSPWFHTPGTLQTNKIYKIMNIPGAVNRLYCLAKTTAGYIIDDIFMYDDEEFMLLEKIYDPKNGSYFLHVLGCHREFMGWFRVRHDHEKFMEIDDEHS